ncbi:MAG: Lrp/AsnC family transcriptional regulator [Crocinitomicaceae bacterium]|nr:Lrp/AsnC family transcriptional regulator [Crocinitomicaceae bacterium]
MKLDKIDFEIIALLEENAKLGNKELAGKIGLTVTPTYERIKRLERIGVISGYTAIIDKKKIGLGLKVYCHVSLKAHSSDLILEFESEVVKLTEISQSYHITGDSDYMLVVEVKDMEDYHKFLKLKLASLNNISNVQSTFVMSTLK